MSTLFAELICEKYNSLFNCLGVWGGVDKTLGNNSLPFSRIQSSAPFLIGNHYFTKEMCQSMMVICNPNAEVQHMGSKSKNLPIQEQTTCLDDTVAAYLVAKVAH